MKPPSEENVRDDDEDSDSSCDSLEIRKNWEMRLKQALIVNEILKKRTQDDALTLFCYARVLLLDSSARARRGVADWMSSEGRRVGGLQKKFPISSPELHRALSKCTLGADSRTDVFQSLISFRLSQWKSNTTSFRSSHPYSLLHNSSTFSTTQPPHPRSRLSSPSCTTLCGLRTATHLC